MRVLLLLTLVLSLLLVSCQEEAAKKGEAVQQEAVIQKEVESRVEVILSELKTEQELKMLKDLRRLLQSPLKVQPPNPMPLKLQSNPMQP